MYCSESISGVPPGSIATMAATFFVAQLRAQLAKTLSGREEGYSDGERLIPGREQTPCLRHILEV